MARKGEYDLETGLNNIPIIPASEKQKADQPVADSSSSSSAVPDNIERGSTTRDPELKDVFNAWWGRSPKEEIRYKPPPKKGDRFELETFQNLVGIHFLRPGGGELHPGHQGRKPASPMHDIFMPTKAAAKRWRNRGLYDRSISQDTKNRVLYGMSTYLISFLYLLQILIAAALTGLSAYQQSSSVALTVLGAINTVLAGILAWLNGQGMPVRFRRARDQYREVVRAIEDTERTFAEIDYVDWPPGTRPNPYAERDRLEQMYEEARQDQERNYPDIQEGPNKNQMEGEAKQLRETISDEKSKKGAFSKMLEKTKGDHVDQLKKLEEQFTERIKAALKDQEGRIRTEVEFEHLQKVAEEQERKFQKERAEYEARLGGPRPVREPSPPRVRDQNRKPARAAERPNEGGQPREAPRDGPSKEPRQVPHNDPRDEPRENPREAPRARSSARSSPARSPAKPREKSPVRNAKPPLAPVSPVRQPRTPARSPVRPARSPSRSPDRARPASKSPPRARPARSPSPARAGPASKSPSRSPSPSSSESGDDSKPRGPPGLFTNTPRSGKK